MPPKATQSAGEGGQKSLLNFFSKAPAASASQATPRLSSSSSSTSLATPPLAKRNSLVKQSSSSSAVDANKAKPSTSRPSVASSSSASRPSTKAAITPPTTSEGDVNMDSDEERPVASSSKPIASSSSQVPMKRAAPLAATSDEEEEDDEKPVVSKKRNTATKSVIIDSESEDDMDLEGVKPKPKAKAKAKNKKLTSDDDAFSASGSGHESDDYFNDDMDDFLVNDLDEESLTQAKPKLKPTPAPAKKTAPPPRPPPKPLGGKTGSGTSSIKTQAELQKQKLKDAKAKNEKVFEFLVDPRDMDGIRPGEEGYDPRTLYIPKKAWAEFTPFETQFWEVKQTHYDTVLFFQKGKFFELYEEDASIGHREFDLKLTDRVKMRMVGVPESSFDFWAAKFLAQGYKVGRVDQCETALGAEMRVKDGKAAGKGAKKGDKATNGKAIVRRELKSVYTSGTIVDGSMLTDDLSNHCVAIKEHIVDSSSPPTFGICVLDASTAEFSLSYFEDDASRTQVETLIRQLKPKELIHEKTNLSVSTLRLLRNTLSLDCQWTALKPKFEFLEPDATRDELLKFFAPKEGNEEVQDDDERIPDSIRSMFDKPLAMSALGGMIWYLRQLNLDTDLVTARNFHVVDPLKEGSALVLDGQTLAHIEVLQNNQGGIDGTLLQLLSRCVTPFGKRLFKQWLCAPLREAAEINSRLDAVDDLLANADFCARFDSMVKRLPDLERMLSRIHAKSCKKQEFLKVVAAFAKISEGMQGLTKSAESFASSTISDVLAKMTDLEPLLEEVQSLYDGEELLPVDGVDEGYETVKQNVIDIEDKLETVLTNAKASLKCTTLMFRDIGTKDIYQIQVPVKIKVPNNWIRMSNTKDFNRYYSPEVTDLVQQLKEARERQTTVVNDFQFKVFGAFAENNSTWIKAVRVVAELDCLLSLSKSSAALGEPAVRPEVFESDTAVVEFEELRHPCILSASTDFIPNDVALGGDAKQMILLTGPNMAGKSTMLRMTCAAIIMAQLGCYVPAAKARIAPVDAIFSRMGANDAIFANASTFKVEMDDTTKILTKSTPRSLVILDELGRGTSTHDGSAIAFAVLHRLATHVGCIGFFATHFTSLTEDFNYHPQIRLANMDTRVDNEAHRVTFLFKLVDGSAARSYGPHVASMAGLPAHIVKRAVAISAQFEESTKARESVMRAGQSLALTTQADAAFLARFAQLQVDAKSQPAQLVRTLEIIRAAQLARSESGGAVEALAT